MMPHSLGEWTITVVPFLVIFGVLWWYFNHRELTDDETAEDIERLLG